MGNRLRFIGSGPDPDGQAVPYDSSAPNYLFLPMPGVQGAAIVSTELFHKTYSAEQMVRLFGGVRVWQADFVGSSPGDPSYSWSLQYQFTSDAGDDADILQFNRFSMSSVTGSVTRTPDVGSPDTFTPGSTGDFLVCNTSGPNAAAAVDVDSNYFYDPDASLWLPRFEVNINPNFGIIGTQIANYRLQDPVFGTGSGSSGGSIDGGTAAYYFDVFSPTDSASFTLDFYPLVYRECRDQDGNHPLWDAVTGAALESHLTLAD